MNKDKVLSIVTLESIFVATFFLPLKTSLSNIGLIILIATTIISFFKNGINLKGSIASFLLFSCTVFFLPLVWGIVYSPEINEAFEELGKYALLGVTPLFLFRKDINAEKFRKHAALGLLIGVIICSLLLLIINFYKFSQSDYPLHWLFNYNFTSNNFIEPLGNMHPIYMGMYFSLALAILLFTKLKINNWFKGIGFLLISLSIIFLASRIIYGILILLILLYLLHNLSFKVFAVIVTGVIILFALIFNQLKKTYVFNKTVNGTLWELSDNIGTYNTSNSQKVDSRWSRWLVALEAIKEKPLLGYGGGVENEVLLEKYKEYKMNNSISQEYNAHNQYLGFAIRFGIFGALLLLVYFIKNGVTAFRHQNLLFLSFLTILFWCFMVENILDRNMGINFVAVFGTLFYAEYLNEKRKEEKTIAKI